MMLHRSTACRVAVVGLVLLLAASQVSAQAPRREGFWGSVGAGYGTAQLTCDNCGDVAREESVTGLLILGGALSSSLLLGLELDAWVKSIDGDPFRLGSVTGILQWYPLGKTPFFVKGGLGLAYARGDLRFPNSVFVDNAGLGYLVGLGYDVPIDGNLLITPLASFYGGNVGDVQTASGVNFNVFQVQLALTLY
jgi:hypothetical protein